MKKIIFGVIVLVVVVVSFFSFKGRSPIAGPGENNYKIQQKWELPAVLNEISGIAYIGDDRIACVQDEDGIIFIYNLKTSSIESKTEFGKGGDYEGITVIGNDAYILQSDGIIFEVTGFQNKNPQVQKHVTKANGLPGINFEGICADPVKNQLLLVVKERKNSTGQKEVFSFDLNTKTSPHNPLFVVNLSDPLFNKVDEKLKNKFSPGEINIHPQTREYFILDGTKPKILITGEDGKLKELIMLKLKDFGNPEGLTFSPKGDLYISNEAEDGPANILKISLTRTSR